MSDPRAVAAREAHRLAGDAASLARRRRRERDALVKILREEDRRRWTYPALAAAVGCSPELIAAIVQGRTVRPGEPPDEMESE